MSAITALLGPTNTGKTHRAIERMLEHPTGMIGLPLRLLAREVYDKVSAKVGEEQVALVTGEEQRIPRRPQYIIATVEAMPERDVAFVAIDEVQLAAHEQRGHVFTSRILRARGTEETWLLGAGTMARVLAELVPTARRVEHPRLSRLTYAGPVPLSRIPPRSAVVAFSMNHVYEIAERLRARKGGAAVVLGALSPRTRNAQVAMFQSGEVDYLVASDAIGMGLNLDVTHVAFAATRKFDGRDVRDVEEAELGQIAGRAGRWIQDGTFGTIAPHEMPNGVAMAIEAHRFPMITRVRWRNDELDFASVEALRASLAVRPKRGVFVMAFEADDVAVLSRLAEKSEVKALSRGEERVRLLWDVCTIPDFKKLLIEAHADFCAELFMELVERGQLDDAFVSRHVRPLENVDGDVETLVARIAATRTWTYVANRGSWLVSPTMWQERTRNLEDRLSDALHEKLVSRFVDAKKKHPRNARPRPPSSVTLPDLDSAIAIDKSHPFAALAAMKANAPKGPPVEAADAWIERAIGADHESFVIEESGAIGYREREGERVHWVGRLVRGAGIARPAAIADEDFSAGVRQRVGRRIQAFARDLLRDLLGDAIALAADPSANVRGLLHRLEQGLGTTTSIHDLVLEADERARIEAAGIVVGALGAWVPASLSVKSLEKRALLASLFHRTRLAVPKHGAITFLPSRDLADDMLVAIGYPRFGPRAIRIDIAERALAKDDPTLLGIPARELPRVIAAMLPPQALALDSSAELPDPSA